jgi:cobyrinic acid a,c-diamide synthase
MNICPGLVVAGLSGDGGKTLVTLGLAATWANFGWKVAPFKKGPDYIDAAWLTLAAGRPCRNLDTFLMKDDTIRDSWRRWCLDADAAIIEGNRGLFDGMDVEGSHSTATLAKLLDIPVLLVVDATKMTRTVAALVKGVQAMDPDLNLMGIILNRIGGDRHEKIARESIERFCGIPVLGAIRRLKGKRAKILPGRHLGLITTDEHPEAQKAIDVAREVIEEYLDLDRIFSMAKEHAEKKQGLDQKQKEISKPVNRENLRIGIVRDAAFPFYYPENIEALQSRGAEVVEISALNDRHLPDNLDALYVGGGFPETHSERLSGNSEFLKSLHLNAERGLPIYAECGGLMLLTESIEFDGVKRPMSGILPVQVGWSRIPAGHGYTFGKIEKENPFYPIGTIIKGHEFHHSLIEESENLPETVLRLEKGNGVGEGRDGFVKNNVLALYTHVHSAGIPEWADGMIRAASIYKQKKEV